MSAPTYSTAHGDGLDPALAGALAAALRGLKFGSLEVVVHEATARTRRRC
jgi:hypothetical protein